MFINWWENVLRVHSLPVTVVVNPLTSAIPTNNQKQKDMKLFLYSKIIMDQQ